MSTVFKNKNSIKNTKRFTQPYSTELTKITGFRYNVICWRNDEQQSNKPDEIYTAKAPWYGLYVGAITMMTVRWFGTGHVSTGASGSENEFGTTGAA